MTAWRAPAADSAAQKQRRTIRYLAAAIAAVTAVMYLLIGFGVLHVVDEAAADAPPLLDFVLMAGAAFGLDALLLLTLDKRILWVLGALLQVGVIAMYVVVGQQRTPALKCGESPSRSCRSSCWVRSSTSRSGRRNAWTTPLPEAATGPLWPGPGGPPSLVPIGPRFPAPKDLSARGRSSDCRVTPRRP